MIATVPESNSTIRCFLAVLLIMATLAGAVVSAQQHPDFSGRWVLVSATRWSMDVPQTLTVQQPVSRTTALGAPMPRALLRLTVERTFASGSHTDSYNLGVEGGTVGGLVGGVASGAASFQTRFSVRWEGDALVIWNASYSGTSSTAPDTEHSETWELDADGRLVVTVVDRGVNVDSTPNKLSYQNQ